VFFAGLSLASSFVGEHALAAQPLPSADEPGAVSSVDGSRDVGLTWDGWLGGRSGAFVDGRSDGMLALGTTALIQYQWFDAGLALAAGSSIT
jgi:hypothetical protein